MIGFIVKHSGFGIGKIFNDQGGRFIVFFVSVNELKELARTVGGRPSLKRTLLPLNTVCKVKQDEKYIDCRIKSIFAAVIENESHRYQIEFDDGISREVSEVDLVPVELPPVTCPLLALAELQLEGCGTFLKRESLLTAWGASARGALGLRALLSSRIDLRPHQAYVAGTVLMDRIPRYLLADEVGLGKTIEAGIVIHDILEQKPDANILILCPGTLTQQWLCELYSKFSGKVFSLLELHLEAAAYGKIPRKVIVSFTDALLFASRIKESEWDLVVVDETHHVIEFPELYDLTQSLSRNARGCLLLSAIPVQRREEEYLRLLALLEPHRYNIDSADVQANFKQLYDRQIELGRKLRYISRRLGEFADEEQSADRIIEKISELCSFPVLAQDEQLLSLAESLDPTDPTKFIGDVHALLHYIGDRYRISRRILRNRRSQLFDVEPDLRIDRKMCRLGHDPDQFELDASSAVRTFLQSLQACGVEDRVLLPLTRHLFHSLCDPGCFAEFVSVFNSNSEEETNLLEFGGQIGYQNWSEYASGLLGAVRERWEDEALLALQRAAENWSQKADNSVRIATLISFLRKQHRKTPSKKFIIFAGFFGLGEKLAQYLSETFGAAGIAQFTWNMETKAKEKAAMRFKRDPQCWLMVSDETGGEGRNFQFVDELIHFDLPWSVSKIEQRIGRLDRLGRKTSSVCSNVLFSIGEEEDGWLRCLESGFQIFTRSISGLEFALTALEAKISKTAISGGYEDLNALVDDIKERAELERSEDDAQGVLDEASLDRVSAEVFRRAQSTPDRDIALEEAFCDWFSFVCGPGALGFPPTGDLPDKCILDFRPNQIPAGSIRLTATQDGVQPDRVGTFRRQIAQERPDLEFFSVGNEFFDAVCASLNHSTKGRTYAVECHVDHSPWRGFEFSYRPFGDYGLLTRHPGHRKHLDRVLAVRTEHCFVGEDLQLASTALELLSLRRSMTNETKNKVRQNFTLNNGRTQVLSEHYANLGWEALVNRAEAKARIEAKKLFAMSLAPSIEAECARIAEQIRQAKAARAHGWEEEIEGLETLQKAIHGWDLELDACGFLSVKGGLIP